MYTDKNLIREVRRAWEESSSFRAERRRLKAFAYGRQWEDTTLTADGRRLTERQRAIEEGSTPITNNIIRRMIKSIIGQYSRLVQMDRQTGEPEEGEESPFHPLSETDCRGLEELLISGTVAQYVDAESGEIENLSLERLLFRRFSRSDASDCTLIGVLRDLPVDEVLLRFSNRDPERALEIKNAYRNQAVDGGFPFFSSSDVNDLSVPRLPGTVRVLEVWHRRAVELLRVHDPLTAAYSVMLSEDMEKVKRENRQRRKRGEPELTALYDIARAWVCTWMTPEGEVLGTSSGVMTARGYRIAVESPLPDLGVWNKVIDRIEVWVTEETNPHDVHALPITGITTTTSQGTGILAQLPMLPQASLNASLEASPSGRLASFPPGSDIGELLLTADILCSLQAEAMVSEEIPRGGISLIYGHDDFLHLATSDGLVTCQRSNPFRKVSTTRGDWSRVRCMTAQIWGGGAYTRQIIYVATDSGVTALAHDSEGRHTNCRVICRKAPVSQLFVASARRYVYMLLEDGTLTRFAGTRAEEIVTGIDGCKALGYNSRFGELLLLPEDEEGHCVALGAGLTADAYTHDSLAAVPLAGAPDYMMRQHDNGLTEIVSLSDEEGSDAVCRWLSETEMPMGGGMWRKIYCGIGGDGVDAKLRIGQADPTPGLFASPQTLTQMSIKGVPHGLLAFNIRPGATQKGTLATRGCWHVEITGSLRHIYHFSIAS